MAQAFAEGKQNDVVTLTGSNADENGAQPQPTVTLASFRAQAQQRYGERAAEFLALYPAESDDAAKMAQNESARDQARVSTYLWAVNRGKSAKTAAYTYFFTQPLPGPDVEQYGAFHTSEVPYVLNTLFMSDRPFTAIDRRIADQLSGYWANFAANGDPNGGMLPKWPPVSIATPQTMEVGQKFAPIPLTGDDKKLAFWKGILSWRSWGLSPEVLGPVLGLGSGLLTSDPTFGPDPGPSDRTQDLRTGPRTQDAGPRTLSSSGPVLSPKKKGRLEEPALSVFTQSPSEQELDHHLRAARVVGLRRRADDAERRPRSGSVFGPGNSGWLTAFSVSKRNCSCLLPAIVVFLITDTSKLLMMSVRT